MKDETSSGMPDLDTIPFIVPFIDVGEEHWCLMCLKRYCTCSRRRNNILLSSKQLLEEVEAIERKKASFAEDYGIVQVIDSQAVADIDGRRDGLTGPGYESSFSVTGIEGDVAEIDIHIVPIADETHPPTASRHIPVYYNIKRHEWVGTGL